MTMPTTIISESIPRPATVTGENARFPVDETGTDSERFQEYLDIRMGSATREKYAREGLGAFISNEEAKQARRRNRAV